MPTLRAVDEVSHRVNKPLRPQFVSPGVQAAGWRDGNPPVVAAERWRHARSLCN